MYVFELYIATRDFSEIETHLASMIHDAAYQGHADIAPWRYRMVISHPLSFVEASITRFEQNILIEATTTSGKTKGIA